VTLRSQRIKKAASPTSSCWIIKILSSLVGWHYSKGRTIIKWEMSDLNPLFVPSCKTSIQYQEKVLAFKCLQHLLRSKKNPNDTMMMKFCSPVFSNIAIIFTTSLCPPLSHVFGMGGEDNLDMLYHTGYGFSPKNISMWYDFWNSREKAHQNSNKIIYSYKKR